ncbi:MAG: respiratory nitrate reductase subunit gamma, partial [Pseudonocardiaceae bacterium]
MLAIWPCTRLVHVFSAPLGYLVRPYVVYRSRDVVPGARRYTRAWEQPAPT